MMRDAEALLLSHWIKLGMFQNDSMYPFPADEPFNPDVVSSGDFINQEKSGLAWT
jgi:hypothetical protein